MITHSPKWVQLFLLIPQPFLKSVYIRIPFWACMLFWKIDQKGWVLHIPETREFRARETASKRPQLGVGWVCLRTHRWHLGGWWPEFLLGASYRIFWIRWQTRAFLLKLQVMISSCEWWVDPAHNWDSHFLIPPASLSLKGQGRRDPSSLISKATVRWKQEK